MVSFVTNLEWNQDMKILEWGNGNRITEWDYRMYGVKTPIKAEF